jgi:TetR/AcrR family transcriptional regulator, regulator of autoinduction and epiphytic fitness
VIGAPPARVDPRILRSRDAVLRGALEELAEVGYGAFAIESVAARSGVAKSTIYRLWPDKVDVIQAAFETFHAEQGPDLTSGAPPEQVVRIVRHVAEIVSGSVFSACIPALIDGAERDPRLRAFHHRFQLEARQPLAAVIAEGLAVGCFPWVADPDAAAVALLGVIFYRRLMSGEPFDPTDAGALVDSLLGRALSDGAV